MNKIYSSLNLAFLCVNLALFFVLVLFVQPWGVTDRPDPTQEENADRVQSPLEDIRLSVQRKDSDGHVRYVDVEFPEPMIDDEREGDRVGEDVISFHPSVPAHAFWKRVDQLRLIPREEFPESRIVHVHPDSELTSVDGQPISDEADLTFKTARLTVERVTSAGDPKKERNLLLNFSLPVAAEDLRDALSVQTPEEEPVSFKIEEETEDEEDGYFVRVALQGEEVESLQKVRVHVDGELRPKRGELSMGSEVEQEVLFGDRLRFSRVYDRDQNIVLHFRHRIGSVDSNLIEVSPEVEYTVHAVGSKVRLRGNFEPGEVYRVHIKEGFPGHGSVRVRNTAERTVDIDDLSPEIEFARSGTLLSSAARPELKIRGVNIDEAKLHVQKIYSNNLVQLAQQASSRRLFRSIRVGSSWNETELFVQSPKNEWFERTISLDELTDDEPNGIYRVRLKGEDGRNRETRLLQVSPFLISARITDRAVAVRTVRPRDGSPVPKSTVQLYSRSNQLMTEAHTDKRGIVVLSLEGVDPELEPYLVRVQQGDDVGFVDRDQFEMSVRGSELDGRPYLTSNGEGWIRAEQGAVRPGNTIHLTSIVRTPDYHAPHGALYNVRIYDPNDDPVHEETVRIEGSGLNVVSYTPPKQARTGTYLAKVEVPDTEKVIGQTEFLVDAFVPNRLEGKLSVPAVLHHGNEYEISVNANWLEGDPATDRSVDVDVRLDQAEDVFPDWEAYSFTRESSPTPPGHIAGESSTTDDEGATEVDVSLPEEGEHQVLSATVTAEIEDPSGRPIHMQDRSTVYPVDFVAGIETHEQGVDVVLLRPDGTLYKQKTKVDVRFLKKSWDYYIERNNGRRSWESERVTERMDRKTVTVKNGNKRVKWDVPDRSYRTWYAAELKVDGQRASQDFGRTPNKPDRLRMSTNEDEVQPGETVHVGVDAPFDGTAFVTLEGPEVYRAKAVQMERGSNEVALRVPEDLSHPSVQAVVSLQKPQEELAAKDVSWAAGATQVHLQHPERTTEVTLEAADQVRPESELQVTVSAEEADHAVVALVDEGILQLTNYEDPEPTSFFATRRELDTTLLDLGSSLMGDVLFPTSNRTGGGSKGLDRVEKRLKDSIVDRIQSVAMFQGPVELNQNGQATVRFSLPAYEGRLRLMAVAAGPRSTGSAVSSVRVSGPVGVRLALPRFLSPGDETRVPLTVRNGTEEQGTLEAQVQVEGPITFQDESRARNLQFDLDGSERTTSFLPVRGTGNKGRSTIHVNASVNGASRSIQEEIRVRPSLFYDEGRLVFTVDNEETLTLPDQWVHDSLTANLVVSPVPETQLAGVVKSLIRYPYGCLEQTVSVMYPLTAAKSTARLINPKEGSGSNFHMEEEIQHGLQRIWRRQTSRGSFALWPGGDEYPYGTLWATEILLSLNEEGYDLPEKRLGDALDRIRELMYQKDDVSFRIYGAHLLAGEGYSVRATLHRLMKEVKYPEDRARLAIALKELGDEEEARKVLTNMDEHRVEEREQSGWFRSPDRTDALSLRAYLEVKPNADRTGELAVSLIDDISDPEELTTQERAMVLKGLVPYFEQHIDETEDLRGTVHAAGQTIEFQNDINRTVPFDKGRELKLETNGTGYGYLHFEGYRAQDVENESSSISELKRTFLDPRTGEPVETLRKGNVYTVVIEGKLQASVENLAVTDLLPAGLELEPIEQKQVRPKPDNVLKPSHVEYRDDRVVLFREEKTSGTFTFVYQVRTVFSGTFSTGPVLIEAMYDPDVRALFRDRDELKVSTE